MFLLTGMDFVNKGGRGYGRKDGTVHGGQTTNISGNVSAK